MGLGVDYTNFNISLSSGQSSPAHANISASSGALDEFYAGTLDSTFLEDLTPLSNANHEFGYETDR